MAVRPPIHRTLPTAALVLASACAFPALDPTGLEVAWQIRESNPVDGEDGRRLRTCAGALAATVSLEIADRDDPDRQGTFDHPCELGWSTVEALQAEPSDVFVSLRPGDYDVAATLVGTGGLFRVEAADEVSVPARSQALWVPAFELATVDVLLSLAGQASCQTASFRLRYADADDLVAEATATDGSASTGGSGSGGGSGTGGPEPNAPPTYREGLATDTGVPLSGGPVPCADLAPTQLVEAVDVGRYVLEVTVDGAAACPVAVTLDRPGRTVALDLANLPCAG